MDNPLILNLLEYGKFCVRGVDFLDTYDRRLVDFVNNNVSKKNERVKLMELSGLAGMYCSWRYGYKYALSKAWESELPESFR